MLTLTVTSYRQMPPVMPASMQFDKSDGRIGRAVDNDWTLPDPDQHLSKYHCRIIYQDGRYTIMDTSTNGVFVNGAGQPLGQGNSMVLHDCDRVVIGDFEIEARITGEGEAGPEKSQRADPCHAGPFGLSHWNTPVLAAPQRPGSLGADPVGLGSTPTGGGLWSRIDQNSSQGTGVSGETRSDHVPPQNEVLPVASIEDPPNPLDPPPTSGIWSLPPTGKPTHDPTPPSTMGAQSPTPGPLANTAALQALLRGAGVPHLDLAGQDESTVMYRIGEILRTAVEGLREVLIARGKIKGEFRIKLTAFTSKNNNPLKFSIETNEAVGAILGPTKPGYLPAVAAIREGFDDIKAHEVAAMAATQGAVARLFREFDPEQIKTRIEHHSILDGILPGSRKAKYWDVYEMLYRQIARDMAEDLQGAFGREFARVYEEQIRRL